MKHILKFYQFLGKYKWQMALFLTISASAVVIDTIRPYWLKNLLESAEAQEYSKTLLFFALFGASSVGANWISALSFYCGDRIIIPLSREIRETIFQNLCLLLMYEN